MELRSGFEKVVVASLFSGALLFLSGCGIAGHQTGVASSRVSFGPRCPSCTLTKSTGCQCSPDGWSHGQTAWRPLIPQRTESLETIDMEPYDAEPELAPTENISTPHKTTFLNPKGTSLPPKWGLLPKWGLSWLQPKPIAPLITPSEMVFPAPERMSTMGIAGI